MTNSVAAKTAAGSSAVFTSVVSNAGPDASTNLALAATITPTLTPSSITCTAAGGAVCPTTSTAMTVASLPAGGSLAFAITVNVPGTTRGPVSATVTATSAMDTVLANNSAAATTQAYDGWNGTYQAYSTEGVQVPIEFDFDARTLKAGSAAPVAFTADAGSTKQFTIAGSEVNAKFRVAEDLIVGNVDLGGGVLPFIAARKFVTTIAELGGDYNTLARTISIPGGVPDSRIQAYGFSNGKLLSCQDNAIYTIAACPSGSLWSFDLTVSGDQFTGTDTVHNVVSNFRVAKSGGTTVFLSAGPNSFSNDKRMRIGLPERAGIVAGTYVGGTTTTSWSTVTATTSSFTQVIVPAGGGASLTTGATLTNPGASQYPTGLMSGTRTHDGAPVFVIGNEVLWAYAGALGSVAKGYLTFGVR